MNSPSRVATRARRELKRLARPVGSFDARRYFRGSVDLEFYNVGARTVRDLARAICAAHRDEWSLDDALAFAGTLIEDRHLEVKGLGIEVLARYRRTFAPRLLRVWKRWLADGLADNWATTDAMCGYLIGPLILQNPGLTDAMRTWSRHRSLWVRRAAAVSLIPPMRKGLALDAMRTWSRHRSLWVRRAAAVSLIPPMRKGLALDVGYDVARTLHPDREDLIQKAVGWMLREAGKLDSPRLERYLRKNGSTIPRTTLRYAIERMPEARRRAILESTREGRGAGRADTKRRSTATPQATR
jgi:3-methyladenine DNA glycosylase AlkD